MVEIPRKEGFFWAKWKIATEGTDNCPKCGHAYSTWERDGIEDAEWEVVRVVQNSIDDTDPEYLMVEVPGVATWQPIDNFFWGEEVLRG